MIHQVVSQSAPTCVWMTAGLLTYKLCDRDFDCEHCPLHAALRGDARWSEDSGPGHSPSPDRPAVTFPDDRLYSTSHTWLWRNADGDRSRFRLGLDGFAASILPRPSGVQWTAAPRFVMAGEDVCELEFRVVGGLPLHTPVSADIVRWNLDLTRNASAVVERPYSDGWLVELSIASEEELGHLLRADAARRQARLDCRRLRRQLAFALLAEAGAPSDSPDDEALLTDLREILGGSHFRSLLRELIP